MNHINEQNKEAGTSDRVVFRSHELWQYSLHLRIAYHELTPLSLHFFSLLTIEVNVFYPVEGLRFSSEEFHLDGMVYVLETDMKNKVIFTEMMPKWKWTLYHKFDYKQ